MRNSNHPHTMFFFTVPVTTGIYTLSLHDALPISGRTRRRRSATRRYHGGGNGYPSSHRCQLVVGYGAGNYAQSRSEEHTSEIQSLRHLVCRLLLEKKKIFSSYT